ncbi:MAG: sigma-70 family RNA polymerase sigma factor [Planctomycetes bacterium]|nr:sigma-70 family RNA polymerase sigma factor [Planctomycetota bacterium]
MDADRDSHLLDRSRTGDESAVEELFQTHQSRLLRLVDLRLDARLRSRIDPLDVVQEAWVEIVKRLPTRALDDPLPLRVWLRLMTLQSLAQAQRRNLGTEMRDAQREVAFGMSRPSVTSAGLAEVFMTSATSPSQSAQREEVRASVARALEELGEVDREIVLLRHFEGLSNEDAAAELAIDPAAASKRFLRALVRLRPALARLEPGHGAARA